MRAWTAALLILIAIAAGTGGLYYSRAITRPATEKADRAADRSFAQSALNLLQSATLLDEQAAEHARLDQVREFARRAATDDRNLLEQLTAAVHKLGSDFAPAPSPEEALGPYQTDHHYLQTFVGQREQALSVIEATPSIQNVSLKRFESLWRATASDELSEAQELLMSLPAAASNIHLLLLIGLTSLAAGIGIWVYGRPASGRS